MSLRIGAKAPCPWTRLEGTELWKKAEAIYDGDRRRLYHVMDHVRDLYRRAEQWGLDYDAELDRAILAHDVIYDDQPNKELRSWDWLKTNAPEAGIDARLHIQRTIDHKPCDDNRMVLLDLGHFMSSPDVIRHHDTIISEGMMLHGVDRVTVARANRDVMKALRDRILEYLDTRISPSDQQKFLRICAGIDLSVLLSDNILNASPQPGKDL